MDDQEFTDLLAQCAELASEYEEGLCFIGGIAVYLHAINTAAASPYAEFTHDADAYISLADLSDLRDREELTTNRRLSKHQLVRAGFEFDIYSERQSSLLVPYDAVMAAGETYDGIRVASLEHLLVLKAEAYRDRKGSSKGDKDAKDLLRLAVVGDARGRKLRPELALPYLSDRHIELLHQLEKGPAVVGLAKGNAVVAKKIRSIFRRFMATVLDEPPDHSNKLTL